MFMTTYTFLFSIFKLVLCNFPTFLTSYRLILYNQSVVIFVFATEKVGKHEHSKYEFAM